MADLFSYEPSPARRIDVTIDRLRALYDAATEEQQTALRQHPHWPAVDVVLAVRAMERGDGGCDLADAYDRVVEPGGSALDALVATFRATYGGGTHA